MEKQWKQCTIFNLYREKIISKSTTLMITMFVHALPVFVHTAAIIALILGKYIGLHIKRFDILEKQLT